MDEKNISVYEDLEKAGYSKEEEYFYRMNRELIEKKRMELDEKRVEQRTHNRRSIHWMKCPKCGNQMTELNFSGIYADQCKECQGIYFDRGEFETFLEAKSTQSFLKSVLKHLRTKLGQLDTNSK